MWAALYWTACGLALVLTPVGLAYTLTRQDGPSAAMLLVGVAAAAIAAPESAS